MRIVFAALRRIFRSFALLGRCVVCILLRIRFALVRCLFVLQLRRDGRGLVGGQHSRIDMRSHIVKIAGHIDPVGGRARVGAGDEVKVLAVAIESRLA